MTISGERLPSRCQRCGGCSVVDRLSFVRVGSAGSGGGIGDGSDGKGIVVSLAHALFVRRNVTSVCMKLHMNAHTGET